MKTVVAMGLAVFMLLGAAAAKDEDALQGTWRLSAGEANGKPLSEKQLKDGKLVIKGDHYSVTLNGGEAVTGVQTLASAQGFKMIDITDNRGSHKDQSCLGIYELKGDEFRVAFAPPGKDRPEDFSTTPDSGHWVHLWKRVTE